MMLIFKKKKITARDVGPRKGFKGKDKNNSPHLCNRDKSYVSIPIKIKYTLGKTQLLFFTIWN